MVSRRRTLVVLLPLALAACSEQRPSPTAVAPPPAPASAAPQRGRRCTGVAWRIRGGSERGGRRSLRGTLAGSDRDAGAHPQRDGAPFRQEGEGGARRSPRATCATARGLPVIPEAHKKANCPEGWYELLAGGFVCGKYATLDLEHPRFKLAKAPDLTASIPYTYGVNIANGTPLYRQVPSREERLKLEPWLTKPKRPKAAADEDNPYAPASASTVPDAGASEALAVGENAGSDKPDTPWWQKEAPDAGPPAVTLEDLQESDGPIARRMVKGFFLSLDHQFGSSGIDVVEDHVRAWWPPPTASSSPSR